MFFSLMAIDHPCCRMQEVVESFFENSIEAEVFSMDLFPEWFQGAIRISPKSTGKSGANAATGKSAKRTLGDRFSEIHILLHSDGVNAGIRRALYNQLTSTNRIKELCDGTAQIQEAHLDWDSALGKSVKLLMSTLYDSLDLSVFKRNGSLQRPTLKFYDEFIQSNKHVCPFCGLERFKNRLGPRREDFDHYLHQSDYPLASANMKNLVPTCGTCNQDFKKTNDILADGVAFYPFAEVPEIKLEIDCNAYPAMGNFDDRGQWAVSLELANGDATAIPKLKAWNRVYAIKRRLEDAVKEYSEEWMSQVCDDHQGVVGKDDFLIMIESAKTKARRRAERRVEAGQIIKAAFYDFMLTKADAAFLESFRILRNRSYA